MIVSVRTVKIPEQERARFLRWIADSRVMREAHGILAALTDPSSLLHEEQP